MHINDLCKNFNIDKGVLKDHNFVYSENFLIDNEYIIAKDCYNYFCSKCDVLMYFISNRAYIFVTSENRPRGDLNLVCFNYDWYDGPGDKLYDKKRILDCNSIIVKSIIE